MDQANSLILKALAKSGYDKVLLQNGEVFLKSTQVVSEKLSIRSFLEFHQKGAQDMADQLYLQQAAAAAEESEAIN